MSARVEGDSTIALAHAPICLDGEARAAVSRKPDRLFKYLKKVHLEPLLARGVFRIGTLFEYREIERLGGQIGDDGEGTKAIHMTAADEMSFDLLSDDPRAVHARKVVKGWDQFHPASRIVIVMQPKSKLVLNEESGDLYVFSAATSYNVDQMHAFGYDAAIMICDPEGFFVELSNAIQDADFVLGAEVQYRERSVDFATENVAPPAFLKPLSYSAQSEFRAVWQPRSVPIKPLIIEAPRALLYCAEYHG